MKRDLKTKFLWIAIILCFFLMCGPAVILLDRSNFTIMHLPAIYLSVFALWAVLCVLTFIGYKLKWGEKQDSDDKQDTKKNDNE